MLKSLFQFLEPAPYTAPITDPSQIKQQYRYWRIRIVSSMYIGYVVFYMTRKSFTFVMPFMTEELGFSKAQLGILATVLYISYGCSKFLSGILSDRSNPRYFMAFGLILTGACNILFGFSSSIIMLALFWGLNGWFQAWGWPAMAKSLTHWYNKKQRGFWWSLCTTSHNIGGALIPLIAVACAQQFGWRFALFVPGVLSIIMGLILINRLRDVPPSLGLPPIEDFEQGKQLSQDRDPEQDRLSAKQILMGQILNNPWVWMLAVSYFFIFVIRMGINDWSPFYFIEAKHHAPMHAGATIAWYEAGGFLGILMAGWITDKYFNGNRLPYILMSIFLSIVILSELWLSHDNWIGIDLLLMGMVGFSIYGPHMLIGLIAAEFVHKNAAAIANGFAGLFGYFGAAASGFPLGLIVDHWSWDGFFTALIACALINFALISSVILLRSGIKIPKRAFSRTF